MLYFAYGSNMSKERMLARVPSAKFISVGALPEHQLRFHQRGRDNSAKADAYFTGKQCDVVYGVLYELQAKDVDCLDAFEGIGMCYDSKPVEVVVQPENRVVQAYTYFAIHIDPSLKPYHWYKHHIVQGAKEAELPVEYVADIGHVPSIDDPDGDRHQREMMIYSLAPR